MSKWGKNVLKWAVMKLIRSYHTFILDFDKKCLWQVTILSKQVRTRRPKSLVWDIMRRDTWKSETSSPPLKGAATAILNLVYSSKASLSCWVTPSSTQQWKHTGERVYCRKQLWHCKNKTDVVEVPTIVCSAFENKAPVALNSSDYTFFIYWTFF